jgi:hypothetical protein
MRTPISSHGVEESTITEANQTSGGKPKYIAAEDLPRKMLEEAVQVTRVIMT